MPTTFDRAGYQITILQRDRIHAEIGRSHRAMWDAAHAPGFTGRCRPDYLNSLVAGAAPTFPNRAELHAADPAASAAHQSAVEAMVELQGGAVSRGFGRFLGVDRYQWVLDEKPTTDYRRLLLRDPSRTGDYGAPCEPVFLAG